jgi:type 1 fimbriae regulatory protein FimB
MDALSTPELLKVLAAARRHSERNFLMILVAYSHGLRASELVSIVKDDIKEGRLQVQRLKRSNETNQSLHRDQNPLLNEHQALLAFVENLSPKQKLFPLTRRQFGRIVARHAAAAGMPKNKRKPHMLKHTMGAEIYEKTKDLRLVRMRLGHKREASSLIYSGHVTEQLADAEVEAIMGSA